MTVCNVWISAERAMVSVDSMCEHPDGSCGERSKLFLVPHALAVLSGRGRIDYLAAVLQRIAVDGGNFDEVADSMPSTMHSAQESMVAAGVKEIGGQVFWWVGYSARSRRILAWRYERPCSTAPIEVRSLPRSGAAGATLSPWEPSEQGEPPCEPDDDAGALRLARLQVSHWQPRSRAFGGRLLVAEINAAEGKRPSISLRDVGDFEVPAAA